jgi:hypothetical protein
MTSPMPDDTTGEPMLTGLPPAPEPMPPQPVTGEDAAPDIERDTAVQGSPDQ